MGIQATETYIGLFVRAALASGHLRVLELIYQEESKYGLGLKCIPISDEQRWDRSHPWLQACDDARGLCGKLARYCRRFNLDPRISPLYEGLKFKDEVNRIMEKNKVVDCEVLTPAAIFNAAEKGNILRYKDWTLTVGRGDFATDAYGQDQWCDPLVLTKTGNDPIIMLMPGEEKLRARKAYQEITSVKFTGDDGLGKDPLHAYERYCGLDEVPDSN